MAMDTETSEMDAWVDIDYEQLPEHLRRAVKVYIEQGRKPGGFLQAVICNLLMEALGRADETSRARLHDIVRFFYNEAPPECWGSLDRMKAWVRRGGLESRED